MEASSAINTPHPDDVAEPSFGPPDLTPEQAAAEGAAYRREHGEPEFDELAGGQGFPDPALADPAPAAATPEEQAAEAADSAPEPTNGATAGEQAQAASVEPGETERQRGSVEREYIVFHRVPLTERVLKMLLADMNAGNAPEPMIAFVELHRALARNDKQAVTTAYRQHRSRVGAQCDLAAVSSRSFKERHLEPDAEPQEPRLKIT